MTTWFPAPKRTVKALASAAVVVLGVWVMPTLAGDPFRTSNPRAIGDNTEAAFNSIFKEGDYKGAKSYLNKAEATEPNEPLAYAMQAALAYTNGDLDGLNNYATKTLQTAQKLTSSDPVRGNLYTGVGYFLEGAYDVKKPGGTPVSAVSKLQKVFQFLDEAKKTDHNDPELNLVTGYMDLILAVNLPFSDPSQAITKLEKFGSPSYLAYRGIAIGYRDLKQYGKAMEFVDRALALTPNNPEVLYLKAQILRYQDKKPESLEFFKKALEKQAQLPKESAAQISFEQCRLQNKVASGDENKGQDCKAVKDEVRRRVD